MKKIIILFIFLILGLNLISAGLCKNDYGYYYCSGSRYNEFRDYYKEVEEYKRTITQEHSTPWGFEKITQTLSEKTTIEKEEKPHYKYYRDYDNCYDKCRRKSGKRYYDCIDDCRYGYDNYYYKPRLTHDGYYNWRYSW